MAADWCAGRGRGKKALVIASDIARYEVGSAGEPTQGAGAVAMLVSDNPRLLAFEDHEDAVFTRDVMDFWRPMYRTTALVQGKLSLDSYLLGLRETWTQHKRQSGLGWDDYAALLFHVPFPKMAVKAHALLAELEGGDAASFTEQTSPHLEANRVVGNIYSGSLYLSLLQLLHDASEASVGERVGMYSYGSGSCGEFFSGVVGPDAAAFRSESLMRQLEQRRPVTHAEYLRLREAGDALEGNGTFYHQSACRRDGCPEASAFLGVRDHERVYCNPLPGGTCLWTEKSLPLAVTEGDARRTVSSRV